jgi:TfoX/Sxy family transcriptional regulator of competence genes
MGRTPVAYDEGLAQRVREQLEGPDGLASGAVTEKKMFGGLCFLVRGNMCCGLVGEELMVRVGPAAYEAALALPHAREMDFTGRALNGMVYVSPAGLVDDDELAAWVARGVSFARALPAK